LGYEESISTSARAKNSIGLFLPFSTVSTQSGASPPSIAALRKDYSIASSAISNSDGATVRQAPWPLSLLAAKDIANRIACDVLCAPDYYL
jgi:hypothetical protein